MILYLNDTLIDLFPGTIASITVNRLNVGDLKSRLVNYTSQISIPRTSTNESVFELSGYKNINSTFPYKKFTVKMIESGIELISDGVGILVSAESDRYNIRVFENDFDIFNEINSKQLNEFSIVASSAWNAAGIDSARATTSGIISAVINYGRPTPFSTTNLQNYFLPSIFYKTVVESVLKSTGLSLSGSILTNTAYTDLIINFPIEKWAYPDTYISQFYQSTTGSGTGGGAGWGNQTVTNSTYSPPSVISTNTITAQFDATVSLSAIVWSAGTVSGTYWLELVRTRSAVDTTVYSTSGTSTVVYASTSGTLTGSATGITMISGDSFRWVVKATQSGGTATLNSFAYSATVMTVSATSTIDRASVPWQLIMSSVPAVDIIQDFVNRFGIIFKKVGQTLYLKTLNEIFSDTGNAVDWSDKLLNDDIVINYELTNYAQNNYFEYTDSIDVPNVGRGSFTISNTILPTNQTVFTSAFENCVTETTSTITCATIPVYDSTSTGIDNFINTPGIKVLTLRSKVTGESNLTFNTTARSDYKVAYHVDVTKTKDSGFQYFIDNFYSLFVNAIQTNKIITKTFLLTELDIANFDPFFMVYDGTGYYMVNKISNYVPGQKTKVELFKVI